MKTSSESITSIAIDCGYNDPGYFGRVFKQETGVTPQEWRWERFKSSSDL